MSHGGVSVNGCLAAGVMAVPYGHWDEVTALGYLRAYSTGRALLSVLFALTITRSFSYDANCNDEAKRRAWSGVLARKLKWYEYLEAERNAGFNVQIVALPPKTSAFLVL